MVASECRLQPGADASGAKAQRQPGILVVDDENSVRSILGLMLQREGFRVWLASTGKEAVEVYRREGGSMLHVFGVADFADYLQLCGGLRRLQELRRQELLL